MREFNGFVIIGGMFAYIGLGGLCMHLIGELPRADRKTATLIFVALYFSGWIVVMFGLFSGSFKFGWQMLRYYVAAIVAISIVGIAMWLPHPAVIVGAVILGGGVAYWIATGKTNWKWWE